MAKVTLEIPDDLLARLPGAGAEVGQELRLAAAFSLCSQGILTTGEAARLAGLGYGAFLQAAGRARVELFPINVEELKHEMDRPIPPGLDVHALQRDLSRGSPTGG